VSVSVKGKKSKTKNGKNSKKVPLNAVILPWTSKGRRKKVQKRVL